MYLAWTPRSLAEKYFEGEDERVKTRGLDFSSAP